MARYFRMLVLCIIAGGVFNKGGIENGGECGKKGYIYSRSCNLVHIQHCIGQ